ncbi:MAG: NUDIX hydrolase [Pseudomonadota bacterium]|mgnify:CR=1 FL=1
MSATTKFCNACGHAVEIRIPEGDHRSRHLCPSCGHIQYFNPRVIAGVIAEWQGKVLMCKRAIQPRLGYWTFPAGFLELGETSAAGAARETLEEAEAEIVDPQLLAVISVPHVSQIYLIHRAQLRAAHHAPTPESSETRLMDESEIPWDNIAFPTVWQGLKFYFADRNKGRWDIHSLDLHWPLRADKKLASS